jgi:hypothetical protein
MNVDDRGVRLSMNSRFYSKAFRCLVILLSLLCIYLVTGRSGDANWVVRIEKPAREAFSFVSSRTSPRLHAKVGPIKNVASTQLTPSEQPKPVENTNLPLHISDPSPPASSSPKTFFTVATMIKNKRRWLREWIEFYRMMGVEHFIIYDNESTDDPLDVLRYYINEGMMTYVPWPPREIPPPKRASTRMEEWQDSWFRDCLDTCLHNDWAMHRQGPCQLAAFTDAVRRTKGESRWLGIWDVDEFIFPRLTTPYHTLADVLREEFSNMTQLRIYGNVFGTSGHVQAPRRVPGSPLQPLITEEYTWRAELDRTIYGFLC